jgi:2-methylcitrate dehydratase PrpD
MQPIARQLAEWCADVAETDIPAEVSRLVPLRMLDTMGLIVAGSATEAVKAARALAETLGGAAQSTVIGSSQQLPACAAALVHGVAAHCHDFDDTFADSVVHPGSIIIPTAIAVSEASGALNADFCAAVTVGYEVAARLGAVAGRRFHARNMHATGLIGPIAAAVTAGRLRRLAPERISWAMGLAASMAGGIRAYARDGGWSKWLHAGWAAHGGIMAAHLAAGGFRGPEYVFDGGSDLFSVMLHGETLDRTPVLSGLGKVWSGVAAEFKYYPCAHVIQPFIEAVLAIVRDNNLQGADIAEIECTIAPWAAAIVCEPAEAKLNFATELEAIGSLPYQLSVAVLERRVGLETLREETRGRADIAVFAKRIKYRKDETLGRRFDGAVEIRTVSGQKFVAPATLTGNDWKKVRKKFEGLVVSILGVERASAMADRLLECPADWRAASDLLRAVPSGEPSAGNSESAAPRAGHTNGLPLYNPD